MVRAPRGGKAAKTLRELFATPLYEASLAGEAGFAAFNAELEEGCLMLAREDLAGRAWARANLYPGYTSYASLNDLPARATVFARLKVKLDRHVAAFADALAFDLGPRGRLKLDSLWASVIRAGGAHGGHIHPSSVISGTVYVATPPGSGALRLEDPRGPLMMAAPPRRADAPEARRTFVTLEPAPGRLFLWESWLRHEVLPGRARSPRISLSFNYAWG
ncbi:MAG: hypothetical protein JOZ27_02795 [Caulobacteraceae bacterium]|nr:hypothetical protein [Caulobacteraceae bacterium]